MDDIPTITINMDKKCSECGKKGAAQCGLCIRCAGDRAIRKIKEAKARNAPRGK